MPYYFSIYQKVNRKCIEQVNEGVKTVFLNLTPELQETLKLIGLSHIFDQGIPASLMTYQRQKGYESRFNNSG